MLLSLPCKCPRAHTVVSPFDVLICRDDRNGFQVFNITDMLVLSLPLVSSHKHAFFNCCFPFEVSWHQNFREKQFEPTRKEV